MKRTVVAGSRRIEYVLIQAVRRNILIQALPEGETRVYAPKTARLRDERMRCVRLTIYPLPMKKRR